jgi:predicted kinase
MRRTIIGAAMKAAIFDLDGTLCDCRHRLHHVTHGKRNWDAFFAGVVQDTINEPIYAILTALRAERCYAIVLCSGRPEKCRADTVKWLEDHDVFYDVLYMRPDNDTRPDHVVKAQILEGMKADGYEPFVAIDDRDSICKVWRESGIMTLQCAPSGNVGPSSSILTVMVGPSGAGKGNWISSAVAGNLIRREQVISSDQIREEMCGDFRDQSKNAEVFEVMHDLAATRLKHGLNVVLDATHLRRKDRLAAVALAKGGPVRYIVINRPVEAKRQDGGWRNEVTKNGEPFDLIAAHEQTFQSQLRDILAGDGFPNVSVGDMRRLIPLAQVADFSGE